MQIYFAETAQPLEKLVDALKKSQCGLFIVVKPEFGFAAKLLEYTLFSTYKSFQRGKNEARDQSLAWLCALAGTDKIDKAAAFAGPDGKRVAIASEKPIDFALLKQIKLLSFLAEDSAERKKAEKKLAQMYGISDAALANYSLEELLIEKAAVARL